MSLQNKKVILGICGSIAAYKAAFLTRLLVKNGAEVRVVMTHSATGFVAPVTLSTLSRNAVVSRFVENSETGNWTNHVELGLWADLMLIAPASANSIAKMAGGLCDNMLLAIYLSARCDVFLAPAMDMDMYRHPSVQRNIERLRTYGNRIIEVGTGELASGLEGEGRMAEPEEIISILDQYFSGKKR
jgi:phosphopantothenoylcysteine decarboxylase/phosphopantothenate--cysteine ligase